MENFWLFLEKPVFTSLKIIFKLPCCMLALILKPFQLDIFEDLDPSPFSELPEQHSAWNIDFCLTYPVMILLIISFLYNICKA